MINLTFVWYALRYFFSGHPTTVRKSYVLPINFSGIPPLTSQTANLSVAWKIYPIPPLIYGVRKFGLDFQPIIFEALWFRHMHRQFTRLPKMMTPIPA